MTGVVEQRRNRDMDNEICDKFCLRNTCRLKSNSQFPAAISIRARIVRIGVIRPYETDKYGGRMG
jgi:hypothetical protein